jgi:hypothetical protein
MMLETFGKYVSSTKNVSAQQRARSVGFASGAQLNQPPMFLL